MRIRRAPKPKVTPHVVIRAAWTIEDPARDEREAQVEIRAWAERCPVPVPRLPAARP